MTRPIVIRGGRLVGAGQNSAGDIVVLGGLIADVTPSGQGPEDAELIDARDMIVAPGFVDGHRHTWQTQLRTVASDWTLFDYLVQMRSIYSSFYTAEDAYLGNYVGALEAVNAGVTTLVDHSHLINSPEHADRLIDGLEDAGIRAIFCYGLFVNPTHQPFKMEPTPGWRYDDCARIRRERLCSDNARVLFGLSPQEAEAVAIDKVAEEIAFARELGAKAISYHVAMGAYDGGSQVVAQLSQAGLLREDLLFVHGASLTDAELKMLRDSGGGLIVTPETELQMGMGFPAAFRALDAGVRTGLGIDIVSNYPGDMFSQMRLALQVQRATENASLQNNRNAPKRLRRRVDDVLNLATSGGAAAIGLAAKVGAIAPNMAADLILIRTDAVHLTPATDAVGALVLNAHASDVDTVLIDGVVRKRRGALVDVDWNTLSRRLHASAERITVQAAAIDKAPIEAIWSGLFPHLV